MPALAKPARGTSTRARATRYRSGLKTFRDAVWTRDKHCSRASGRHLTRGSSDPQRGGQAAHLGARSSHPDRRFDPDNGILLSIEEHRDSDPRTAGAGGRVLLEIVPIAPDTVLNGRNRLLFIRRDSSGRELWRRIS
jgi:hypothetical protein